MADVVVGLDGVSPVYDPEGLWKTWALSEIWQGVDGPGSKRFVPNVLDYVRDPETYTTWIVDHLDPVTLKPTLREIRPVGWSYVLSEQDLIFGVGPSAQMDTYRAFLNDSVFPHTMCLDPRFMPKGTMASYCKVFLGTDTSVTGEVLSKVYDASGNFISTAVPLELVALDSHTNYAVKIVKRFNVTKQIVNGERVTAVIYADDGHVVERRQFLVENTDTIADVSSASKYISEISLESIWLSQASPDQIDYPLNIPMDALNVVGVVTYSDGSTMRLPVDGGRFALLGLEGRLSTIIGQPHELVLRYRMSDTELAYASTGVNGKYITKPYRIITTNPNNTIAVKLFGYPFWEGESNGYRIRWFLLNLDRNIKFEVTEHVRFAENTGAYDPKLYGYLQRKSVSINLRDVSQAFIPFIHTQVVDIYLQEPADNNPEANWTVATEATNTTIFGAQIWGNKNGNKVSFRAGHADLESWLNAYYYNTLPLVDPTKEARPMVPTHFVVNYGGVETEWSISDWDKELNIAAMVTSKSTVSIRFLKRMAAGDVHLSYAAAMIKQY